MYIYVETSEPRKTKDAARIVGPLMRGPQCMTFYYHMYGYTMSCVVIYIRRQGSNRLRPVWLKSENRGRVWTRGQISINETGIYQVSCAVFVSTVNQLIQNMVHVISQAWGTHVYKIDAILLFYISLPNTVKLKQISLNELSVPEGQLKNT